MQQENTNKELFFTVLIVMCKVMNCLRCKHKCLTGDKK